MKKQIVLTCLISLSWGSYAQHAHQNYNSVQENENLQAVFAEEEINKVYAIYLNLQEALVKTSQEQAHLAASELQEALGKIGNRRDLREEAAKVAAANSLADQRKAFTSLSKKMTMYVKSQELSEGKIYLSYCPMANQNQGGTWLSNSSEIRNPYFGDKMLQCGSIKETIQ